MIIPARCGKTAMSQLSTQRHSFTAVEVLERSLFERKATA